MWLARLRRRFEQRRYRDVTIFRFVKSPGTEANWFERLTRAVRRRERFGYDESEVRTGNRIRGVLLLIPILLISWFLLRSLWVLNIFAG